MPQATHPATVSIPTEALQRFAVSIAHVLSNRLSVIMGNAQYLILNRESDAQAPSGENDELTSTLEAILNESDRTAGIVSLLLSFSSRITADGASSGTVLGELTRVAATLTTPRHN